VDPLEERNHKHHRILHEQKPKSPDACKKRHGWDARASVAGDMLLLFAFCSLLQDLRLHRQSYKCGDCLRQANHFEPGFPAPAVATRLPERS
jgi:hypothetical protein